MAEDLVEAGSILGFSATKETVPVEGSALRIDVVWKLHVESMKNEVIKPIPIPEDITVVSIEIQYSHSLSSISHGLIKGQYANSPYHVVVSYYTLPEDFKRSLMNIKSIGLIILDGDKFQDLQTWTAYLLNHQKQLSGKEKIPQKVYKAISDNPDNMEEKIRETIEEEVKLLFTPKKIKELYELVTFPIGDGVILSDSIDAAIRFAKDILNKLNLSKNIYLRSIDLFVNPQILYGSPYSDSEKYNIAITAEKMYLVIPGYNNSMTFETRNVYVKDVNGKLLMWESISTSKVKSFILGIMESAQDYIKSYNINPQDLIEMEQIISTIKKIHKSLNKES
jgi:hypothetical protein